MWTFGIFYRFQLKLQSQHLLSDSFMDHATRCTYLAGVFSWTFKCNLEKMMLEKYQILPFSTITLFC